MSKKVLAIVLVVVAIAAPYAIPEILGVAAGSFAAIAATVAVEAGIALAQSSLMGPGKIKDVATSPTDRLYVGMATTAPRKWVFGGPTALETDLRYETYTGSNQDTYWQVIACASHAVQSIDQVWLDNELAWSASGGVQGRFVGYLAVTAVLEGNAGNAVPIDGTWTSSCRLTGCAYIVCSYKLSDNSKTSRSPFAGGVSRRMTVRGKGARRYDPRLDSTVTGGSGSHRANDQSTWTWDDSGSRNPALVLLFYLLGWRINGKLAVGMGIPPSRLDLASFITAANVCDESVALNGGGTEPRYRLDGVLSEGDDRHAVVDTLCAQMNATLRDAGGRISLSVIKNDLGVPVADFTENDILGDEEWNQTPPLSDCFNIVRGTRIDPSDTALYQPVDFPEVALTSSDGIDRIDTVAYKHTQSNGQAQRLAKQRLQRNQYQGRYSATGGPRWWQVNIGQVVRFSHQGLGWSNKLFRLVGQTISRDGKTKVALLEENAAIYQWDNNEVAAVSAGTPTIYDPRNSPILLGLVSGEQAVGNGNRVRRSKFEREMVGWTYSNPSSLSLGTTGVGHDNRNDRAFIVGATFTGIGQSIGIFTDEALPETRIPVTPGERLFVGADVEFDSLTGVASNWVLQAMFKLTDGSYAIRSVTSGAADQWAVVGGFVLVPTNAVYMIFQLIAGSGGAGTFTMSLGKPMVCSAGNRQLEFPTFVAGPNNGLTDYATAYSIDALNSYSFPYTYDGLQSYTSINVTASLRDQAGVPIAAGLIWKYVVLAGTVNGHAEGATEYAMSVDGDVAYIPVASLGSNSNKVEIRAYLGSIMWPHRAELLKQRADPPAPTGGGGGGGGGSGSLSLSSGVAASFNSTPTVLAALSGTTPSSATSVSLTFDATLSIFDQSVKTANSATTVKLQRLIGSTWTDISGGSGSGTCKMQNWNPVDGSISITVSDTGLSGSTAYQWRAIAYTTSGVDAVLNGSFTVTA